MNKLKKQKESVKMLLKTEDIKNKHKDKKT